jgi:hypothetical protein
LAHEVIGLSGLAQVCDSLLDLLESWLATPRGLPQGPAPSAPLADIYIAPASRLLLRAGYEHSRYSDDFRIPAATYGEARRAHAFLESALRQLGLVLATGKLRTPRIETYLRNLERIGDDQLSPEAREVLVETEDQYFGARVTAPEVDPEELTRAERVYAEQVVRVSADPASTRLMRWALPRLGQAQSTIPLATVDIALRRYPHITPSIAFYIQLLVTTDVAQAAATRALRWLEDPAFKYPWQLGWVLNALAHGSERVPRMGDRAETILFDESLPWFVRGQAAIVCATQQQLPTQAKVFDLYETCPAVTRPDILAAVVISSPRWKLGFLRGAATTPILSAIAALDPDDIVNWI